MNFCIYKGKIIEEVTFNFIYNKKRISIAKTKLQLRNGSIIAIKGFDEMADWMYRYLKIGDIVIVSGKVDYKLETEIDWITKCYKET